MTDIAWTVFCVAFVAWLIGLWLYLAKLHRERDQLRRVADHAAGLRVTVWSDKRICIERQQLLDLVRSLGAAGYPTPVRTEKKNRGSE